MNSSLSTRIDLHTHSRHSDGLLAPGELVERAAAREVKLLALTDHDTWTGCGEARAACRARGMQFVAGVELSASWRGRAIHVIGLRIDEASEPLHVHVRGIVERRRDRLHAIGERLRRKTSIPGDEIVRTLNAADGVPTRHHLARALVAAGHAKDVQDAFDRWLGRDAPGHVPAEWPSLEATLTVLQACGAYGVLAHPHRYTLSAGQLRALVADFTTLGGSALEVSLPGMSPSAADQIARLARSHALAGSAGSDFHDPGVPWNPLGRWLKLPDRIEPLAERLLEAA